MSFCGHVIKFQLLGGYLSDVMDVARISAVGSFLFMGPIEDQSLVKFRTCSSGKETEAMVE